MTATRELLPMRRRNVTQKVRVAGQSVHYTVGVYPDGRFGELFIDMAKQGAALRTWVGETAMLFSVAAQFGVPLETLVALFVGSRSDPSGPVEGHARIRTCTSVMDLVARSLAIDFLGREDLADVPAPRPARGFDYESDRSRAGKITDRVPNVEDARA